MGYEGGVDVADGRPVDPIEELAGSAEERNDRIAGAYRVDFQLLDRHPTISFTKHPSVHQPRSRKRRANLGLTFARDPPLLG